MTLPPHCPIKYGAVKDDDTAPPPPIPLEHAAHGKFLPSFDRRLWMFYRHWDPESSSSSSATTKTTTAPVVKATLMIVHGTVDHSGVYTELAQRLIPSGIAVFAMDLRGWGLSDGESLYLNDTMETCVKDVEHWYHHIHSQEPYQSVTARFLLGKSLGGTVTAFCAAKHPTYWTGLIGLSGAYQLDPLLAPSWGTKLLLQMAAWFAPKLAVKQLFDEHLIVSDETALQAWRDDPLCSKDKVRVGYLVELIKSLEELASNDAALVRQINVPMLMLYGDADQVVTKAGHEFMIRQSQHSDAELNLYSGGYHNLLQEPSLKEKVMSDIQEWIVKHACSS